MNITVPWLVAKQLEQLAEEGDVSLASLAKSMLEEQLKLKLGRSRALQPKVSPVRAARFPRWG